MSKLARIAIFLLLISGGALWFLASGSLNEFIKVEIETLGKQYTNQTVSVRKVNVELSKGAGSIQGLTIANPDNYQQKNAFSLGNIALDIDVSSILEDPIVIESFVIEQPKAFVEFTKNGGANIKDILDAIKKNIPQSSDTETEKSSTQQPNIRVNKLILSGVALTLDLRQLGSKEFSETLPEVNLGAVGGEKGLPANELGIAISKQVLNSIWTNAKSVQKKKLVDKAKKVIQDKIDENKDKLKEKINENKDKIKDKAKDKLKGLLGKFKG